MGPMAHDRIAYWNKTSPTPKMLVNQIEQYGRGLFASVEDEGDRIFVVLPGLTSTPEERKVEEPRERWIEVWKSPTSFDVITRMMDDITNDIADGLYELLVRTHQAIREEDHDPGSSNGRTAVSESANQSSNL